MTESEVHCNDAREERLQLYYERQAHSLIRKDAARSALIDALGFVSDGTIPRLTVEFSIDGESECNPRPWRNVEGLGMAFENYVSRLCEMEKVRFSYSAIAGLTPAHHRAFAEVIEAADMLAGLGWPVNWQQNVQAILEPTEFGIRSGQLIDRYADSSNEVTLREELLLLGTPTYYHQRRSANGSTSPFRHRVLTSRNRQEHGNITLRRGKHDELPAHTRYCSEWIEGRSHTAFRIAV